MLSRRLIALALVCAFGTGCRGSCQGGSRTPESGKNDPKPPAPGGIAAIFAGGRHTCARRDGELRCWGHASHGALGPKVTMSLSTVPTVIPDLEGAVEVAFGDAHGCARMKDGTVRCWGSNEYGALGDDRGTDDSPVPIGVDQLEGVTRIAAGAHTTCVIAGGAVKCWGDDYGATPVVIPDMPNATAIAVGDDHACALDADHKVWCWGKNDHGQLGPSPGAGGAPARVPGLDRVDEIAAAGDYSCARAGGEVLCWGANDDAQLGDPKREDRAEARPVAGLEGATALALGPRHACALRSGGQVVCWAGSDRGPFGYVKGCPKDRRGDKVNKGPSGAAMVYCAAPMPVAGISDAVALVHGLGHACALERGGALRCWGGVGYGELGNRDHGASGSKTPIAVTFPDPHAPAASQARAISIEAGGEWSCAVLADHSVRCWGQSSLGQLGPSVRGSSAKPVEIGGLSGVASLSLGAYHACALLEDGGVRCWGFNDAGALGDGSTAQHGGPVTPVGLPKVTQLAASSSSMNGYTCALSKKGQVWCWGANQVGQSIPGGPSPKSPAPARVPGVAKATQIASGDTGTCAVTGGRVRCWGVLNAAHPGGGVYTPEAVRAVHDAAEIGMGTHAYCIRRRDGTVWCWGKRKSGAALEQIELPGPARALSVEGYHAAALLEDGSIVHWWIEEREAPKPVRASEPAQLSCGSRHCCLLDDQGRVLCWGDNLNAQLGNPDMGAGGRSDVPNRVPL